MSLKDLDIKGILDSINNLHMHVGFFFLHFWYLSVHDFVRLRSVSCIAKILTLPTLHRCIYI